jgi:hypothetical protein
MSFRALQGRAVLPSPSTSCKAVRGGDIRRCSHYNAQEAGTGHRVRGLEMTKNGSTIAWSRRGRPSACVRTPRGSALLTPDDGGYLILSRRAPSNGRNYILYFFGLTFHLWECSFSIGERKSANFCTTRKNSLFCTAKLPVPAINREYIYKALYSNNKFQHGMAILISYQGIFRFSYFRDFSDRSPVPGAP